MSRRRLDRELIRRELVSTRNQAQELIESGQVLVDGAAATKAARLVAPSEAIVLTGPGPRFVSRGGDKLDAALTRFGIEARGKRVADVGASTGGFSDCLIQRGARQVLAIDVGHGQLDHGLRNDSRVQVFERTNIRHLDIDEIGGPVDLVVVDLSFISLKVVFERLVALCEPQGDLLMLVKPQFEAGRVEATKGQGVIRNPAVWQRVLEEIRECVLKAKFGIMGVMVSPLRGANGNIEFFVHCRPGVDSLINGESIDNAIDEAQEMVLS
ncbi:MAG: TlyA family RNA methyltransferase [Actinomycetota bacterium]|nr:16S/23S rRNA (cytidine-2'-O)-methyltransferase [Acidimicrobiaceae bacterium]MEC7915045.1 TlyA family RNA methyltransferase [Actinomycetota bacterium]|tara:strand:+ start:120 stop:926 length:807 start_codon:yes stop_codon:yes gene_type:complete